MGFPLGEILQTLFAGFFFFFLKEMKTACFRSGTGLKRILRPKACGAPEWEQSPLAADLGGLGGFFPPSEHPLHWPEGPWMAGPDSQVHRSRGGGGGQVKVSQIHHLLTSLQNAFWPSLGLNSLPAGRARAGRGEQDAQGTVFKVKLGLRGVQGPGGP